MRRELFSTLQTVELGALEKLSAGDLTYRLTEDADRVSEVLYKSIHDTVPSVQLLVVLGTMVWLDLKLTLAILLAPLIVWLISLFGARVMWPRNAVRKKSVNWLDFERRLKGCCWCVPLPPNPVAGSV